MTRFFCFPLLLVFVFPAFAQDEPPELGRSLPHDPALLMRMREQLSADLQQIQQMLSVVSDVQLVETLKKQQAELMKQLLEVTQRMQAGEKIPNTRVPDFSPGQPPVPGMLPTRTPESVFPMPPPDPRGGNTPIIPSVPRNELSQNQAVPTQPVPPSFPMQGYNATSPYPSEQGYAVPTWGAPDRTWDATPWGPKPPREMIETKQSIDSLRKEIADLKETVKALETQIQLLSRNILLERMKEMEKENVKEKVSDN